MLLSTKHICGTVVEAADGKVGKLRDLLFDDQSWSVRSLVLDAGSWVHRRRVTLPPSLVRHRDWADHRLLISGLTRAQVLESNEVRTELPVGGPSAWDIATIADWEVYWIEMLDHPWRISDDPHLRNIQEVTGYHIMGADRNVGHIADFVLDDEQWNLRFLVIDTRNWWPGKHVLISPNHVEGIDGQSRLVHTSLSRETIEHCPQCTTVGPAGELQTVGAGGQ